ncbi:MAG TPA: hypothetical protein ENJ54_09875 [Chloroflexi bacterium]|nr:hypothetical protein [Chloroflexota bacterium]
MIFLSLGAGLQSTTIAEMVVEGDLPRPTAAIFADTGNEPPWVYEHLGYLEGRLASVGVPLWRVRRKGSHGLVEDIFTPGLRSYPLPPFHIEGERGKGMLHRQCTKEYKVIPLRQAIQRYLLENDQARVNRAGAVRVKPGVQATLWVGISTDERKRARPSGVSWLRHTYPLLEKGMSRADCVAWLRKRGLPIPRKSSCLICPYHSRDFWVDLRRDYPDLWAQVVAIDERLRQPLGLAWQQALGGAPYIHRSCSPLTEAVGLQWKLFEEA